MGMSRRKRLLYVACMGLSAISGCTPKRFQFTAKPETSYFQGFATQIEYPDVQSHLDPQVTSSTVPLAFQNPAELPTWDVTLPEAISMAVQRSEVLRNIGGTVVNSPNAMSTRLNPALVEASPQAGVEAALSAYDAQLTGQMFWQKNNRPNNTKFLVFLPQAFEQTTGVFQSELAKRTATGASFALRHNVTYDNPNSPQRLFLSDFTGWFEAEWRQPLMQGAGLEYNRIAGPGSGIGQYNGVLIARINTDIALHDFESSVITFINEIEGAYWELYFAYRNLDAQLEGRASALQTWQRVKELQKVGQRGGEADAEAIARAQFFQFEATVQNALAGTNGLFAVEQRLRYMLGLPPTDGRLIRPASQPLTANVIYDWESSLSDAMTQRVEVRRQKWSIKRRELELIAARLNRRPRLDALTQYRWRGLGDHLIGSYNPNFEYESLYQNITGGQYQEWQAGMELSYPVGFRQASVAVRHAQFSLAREQALLQEQELRISHDLSNAAREITRAYELLRTNFDRQEANRLQVEARFRRYTEGLSDISFLLQAQQQLAQSRSDFYRSLIDYNLAIRNFNREKGSLLAYNQVNLSESGWPSQAYDDAREGGKFLEPRKHPEKTTAPRSLSVGPYDPSSIGAAPPATPAS